MVVVDVRAYSLSPDVICSYPAVRQYKLLAVLQKHAPHKIAIKGDQSLRRRTE